MADTGFRLGIDFGTSNTVAVLRWPDGRTKPLLFDGSPLLPSAVYVDPAGPILSGRDAVHSARLQPHRFEPYPKRRVEDGTVWLGEREIPVVELVATVLRRVATEAVRVAGTMPTTVNITHPAAWAPQRRETLSRATVAAGLPAPLLTAEPVAAASYFVSTVGTNVPVGGYAVVYDFGAGTFDASVVRRSASGGFDVLSSEGLPDAGGLDVDAAVVAYLGHAFVGREGDQWHRLTHPATENDRRAAWQLWEDARLGKEMLSRAATTYVHVPLFDESVPIGREQLEDLAKPILDRTVTATQLAVSAAGLSNERLAAIFLVGGSSRIPLAATLLHRAFGLAPTAIEQPELVVAEGALYLAPLTGRATVAGGAASPSPVSGVPVSGSPTSPGSPVSGAPVSGTPVSGSPTSPAYTTPSAAPGLPPLMPTGQFPVVPPPTSAPPSAPVTSVAGPGGPPHQPHQPPRGPQPPVRPGQTVPFGQPAPFGQPPMPPPPMPPPGQPQPQMAPRLQPQPPPLAPPQPPVQPSPVQPPPVQPPPAQPGAPVWQPGPARPPGAPVSPSPVSGFPAPVSPSPVSGFPNPASPGSGPGQAPPTGGGSGPYTLPTSASTLSRATYQPAAPPSGGRRAGVIAASVGGGVLAVILVVVLVIWAAGGGGGTPGTGPTTAKPQAAGASPACGFKIAYLGVLTGENSGDGIMIRDAAKLAVDQYNEKNPNCRVTLDEFDTKRTDQQSSAYAEQIGADAKILGVVGPVYRSEVLAAGPILDRHGIPLISPAATDVELSRKGWKVFHRMLGTDADQAVAGALYLKNILKVSKTMVVYDETEFGSTASAEVRRRLGDRAIGSVPIKRTDKDYAAAVKQVTDAGADSIYFAGFFDDGGIFVKQLRTANPNIAVVSGDKIFTQSFIDATGGTAEGVVMTCPCMPADQAAQNFATTFKQKYSETASYYAPEAYDATNIFLSGLNAGKSTRKDMLEYVHAYSGRGVSREVKFTVNGDLDVANLQIWAYKVQGGYVVSDRVIPNE